MNVIYTATVFYGAFVSRDSSLGRKLESIIDAHGGTPAPTGVDGVDVSTVGSEAEEWITIQIKGASHYFDRYTQIVEPARLDPGSVGWSMRVMKFLQSQGIKVQDMPPIGWHVAGSVS